MYIVIDRQGWKTVGKYKTRQAARRAVDRLDNAYGAYRYHYELAHARSNPNNIHDRDN